MTPTAPLPWTDRLALARDGWQTEIRIDRTGVGGPASRCACGVWARRNTWAGWAADVCLHDHAILDITAPDAATRIAAVLAQVRTACSKATARFVDSVPCQGTTRDSDGLMTVIASDWHTDMARQGPRDLFPTEALDPDWEATSVSPTDGHIAALVATARAGARVAESLTPFFGPPRMLRDCANRQWGYTLRLATKDLSGAAGGPRIAHKPWRFTTDLLDETAVAGLISGAHATLAARVSRHAPDLPPGETEMAPSPAPSASPEDADPPSRA